ncbi:MAG: DUF4065 domain-containing protein [Planctomycetes bacterium]|nr:DUF4065 domain-containing protein [Planctomycetota bacterium]
MAMAEAVDIARYLIKLAATEAEPEYLSHMRLQKLLYYIQAWSLVAKEKPAFESPIEAWIHGPVVRRVYPVFAGYGDSPISFHEASSEGLDSEMKNLVASIWQGYKNFSAVALRQKTHGEKPWLEARGNNAPDQASDAEINLTTMRQFFEAEYDKQAMPGLELETLRQAERDFAEGRTVTLEELKKVI